MTSARIVKDAAWISLFQADVVNVFSVNVGHDFMSISVPSRVEYPVGFLIREPVLLKPLNGA